jgi:hypothetical protein
MSCFKAASLVRHVEIELTNLFMTLKRVSKQNNTQKHCNYLQACSQDLQTHNIDKVIKNDKL